MKRTFRVHINRIDTNNNPHLALCRCNREGIILEFQCDSDTTPELKPLMEMDII